MAAGAAPDVWSVPRSQGRRRTSSGYNPGGMLIGFLSLLIFLAIAALPVGMAALILVWIGRGLSVTSAKLLTALAFTVGPAYAMWRMEWFDVWRHGIPSLSYIVTGYAPYLACFAAVGWFAGSKVARVSLSQEPRTDRSRRHTIPRQWSAQTSGGT